MARSDLERTTVVAIVIGASGACRDKGLPQTERIESNPNLELQTGIPLDVRVQLQ